MNKQAFLVTRKPKRKIDNMEEMREKNEPKKLIFVLITNFLVYVAKANYFAGNESPNESCIIDIRRYNFFL